MSTAINPEANVLTYTWHVKDDWYGKNYRMVLLKDTNTGFINTKEAKQYRTTFINYIKAKHKTTFKPTTKTLSFNTYSSFPTYIYCGAGPSYACSNMHVTVAELEEWKRTLESSYEYQQKQRMLDYKRENRKRLKQIKAAKRNRQAA